jgi:hypothetical protein
MLTYRGKGYSPIFVANYDAVAARINGGEDVQIASGPDDICAPLLGDAEPHCLTDSVVERDRLAARDVGALIGQPIRDGLRIRLDSSLLQKMRDAFSSGRTRQACGGCQWTELCNKVSSDDYGDAYLTGAAR